MSWHSQGPHAHPSSQPQNTVNIFPSNSVGQVSHPLPPKPETPLRWQEYQQAKAQACGFDQNFTSPKQPQWQQDAPGYESKHYLTPSNAWQHQHQHYAQQPYTVTTSPRTPHYHHQHYQQPPPRQPQPAYSPHYHITSPQQHVHYPPQHHQHQQQYPAILPSPHPHAHAGPHAHASPHVHGTHHVHASPKPKEPSKEFWYVPAGQAPGPESQGRNIWHGRSVAQVKEDERKYAQHHGGNNPREPIPKDAKPGERFLVIGTDGEQTWHSFATIQHSFQPGRWDQDASGRMFFTRHSH